MSPPALPRGGKIGRGGGRGRGDRGGSEGREAEVEVERSEGDEDWVNPGGFLVYTGGGAALEDIGEIDG